MMRYMYSYVRSPTKSPEFFEFFFDCFDFFFQKN